MALWLKTRSAADVFVAVFEVDAAATCVKDTRVGISLQMKHYMTSELIEYKMAAELYKMGDRAHKSVAGHIATNVVLKQVAQDADVRVVTWVGTNVAGAMVTFQNEVSEIFKFTSKRGVERGSLFGLLQTPEVLQYSAQSSLEGDENEQIKYHRFLIAAVGENNCRWSTTSGEQYIVETVANLQKSMYPVLFMSQAAT